MSTAAITLTSHILAEPKLPIPAIDLVLIMERIALAAKMISHELSAGLDRELGYTGAVNVQGEKVKKLDVFGNKTFLKVFHNSPPVCSLVSEEMDQAQHIAAACREHSYAVVYDPIDGSSNTDVNGSLGTIFAVRRRALGHGAEVSDLLTPGREQVAAGYILYGPGTTLVYTSGNGVNSFTLARGIGEFLLSHRGIRMPQRGATYAVNEGRCRSWSPGARRLVERLQQPDGRGKTYSLRYSGAFVADFHRCLLEGGIYLYPAEVSAGGKTSGKLRLMYEVAPLAMLAEQAGGKASTGSGPVLDLAPQQIHQRVPVFIGSAEEVALAERLEAEAS